MKKLDIRKAACDVAFAACQQPTAAHDAAIAAQADELNLSDVEYQQLKQDGNTFRQSFCQAYALDLAAAKKIVVPVKPAPVVAPAPVQPAKA